MVIVTDAVLVATYDLTDILAEYSDITYIEPNDLRLFAALYWRSRVVKHDPDYVSYCTISGSSRKQFSGLAYPGSGEYLYSNCYGDGDKLYKFKFDCSDHTLVKDMSTPCYSSSMAFTPGGKLTGSTTSTTGGICSRIYEFNLTTGGQSVLYNFETAFGECRRSAGHDFFSDGKILYAERENDQVHLFETDETWLYTWNFSAITTTPWGCTWDGDYLWLISNDDMKLYKLSLPMVAGIGTSGLPIFAKMLI